jgi:hypothetical protein
MRRTGGNRGAALVPSNAGNGGDFPGADGGGAMDGGSAARAGGSGANGLIRIWEFA